jgi:sugar/nucleoside kinase (ribokinase family)
MIDIFSPNHIEFARIFAIPQPELVSRDILENCAQEFTDNGVGVLKDGAVVLRAGEDGSMAVSKGRAPMWLPAFYDTRDPSSRLKVADPTGAGNAFLGAFSIGFLETGNLSHAACYGNVGASFALEQTGIPDLTNDANDEELWNGDRVQGRLRDYMARPEVVAILI